MERAAAGDRVLVTRHGTPLVELRGVGQARLPGFATAAASHPDVHTRSGPNDGGASPAPAPHADGAPANATSIRVLRPRSE
jgi:hypothetical protein